MMEKSDIFPGQALVSEVLLLLIGVGPGLGMDRPLSLPKQAVPTFLAFVCQTFCEQFGRPDLQNLMSGFTYIIMSQIN